MDVTTIDCRTPEGIIVGLIDGMIAMARIIKNSELHTDAITAALKDFSQDEDVQWMIIKK